MQVPKTFFSDKKNMCIKPAPQSQNPNSATERKAQLDVGLVVATLPDEKKMFLYFHLCATFFLYKLSFHFINVLCLSFM